MNERGFDPALLAAVLENAIDGIITIDEDGVVRSFNAAAERIFGYTAAEVVGKKVNLLMPEPDRSRHDTYLRSYIDTGERRIIGIGRDVRGRRKDGTTFPMSLGVSEVTSDRGVYFAGLIRDITERHDAEAARHALIDQLERANAELERFTYTVSHDLKSPLITIKGFLGAIHKDVAAGKLDRIPRDLERIGNAADRMALLLDELLELSRIGRIANPSLYIDMSELAESVVGLLKGPIEAAGAVVSVATDMGTVFGDRTRIGEVFQNAIENALKFCQDAKPHPIVHVGAEEFDGETAFYVRDNGIGVAPQYLSRIFRLFEQLDQSREGSGIGLALCKRIIEVHEGRIWATSDGIGHGTTIHFTIGTAGPED